jgi:hypothetical protein
MLGIAKLIGRAVDHPAFVFSQAYFDAKDHWYDAHGFPKEASGRALIRY